MCTGCFVLINIFLEDLSDPFGSSWNVDAVRQELKSIAAVAALYAEVNNIQKKLKPQN